MHFSVDCYTSNRIFSGFAIWDFCIVTVQECRSEIMWTGLDRD